MTVNQIGISAQTLKNEVSSPFKELSISLSTGNSGIKELSISLSTGNSGIKEFKLADPIHHDKLFKMAEMNIKEIENREQNLKKYEPLIKLYDKAEIINQIDW